jgi:hypothetical protein
MIDSPQITQTAAQLTAFIHLTIGRAEAPTVMGPGLAELMAAVSAQGIATAGPWFTHHLRMDPETFDFEIGADGLLWTLRGLGRRLGRVR